MPIYNKLVRDKIPDIIETTGKTFTTSILTDDQYIEELNNKLHEELVEFANSKTDEEAVEELADVLEIIHALAVSRGSSIEQVEKVRAKKAISRGGFQEKIFLHEVEDE